MVKVMRLLIKARSGHGCSFGVRAWTEMEIWCVEGICGLKVVGSEKTEWESFQMNLRTFLSRYTSLFRTVDTNKPSLSSVYQDHMIVRTRPLYILKPRIGQETFLKTQ